MNLFRLYLKTSRPLFWVLVPTAFFAGLIFPSPGSKEIVLTPVIILQMLCLSFPFALFSFGINDIFDQDSDGINPRKDGSKQILTLVEGARTNPGHHKAIKKGVGFSAVIIVCSSLLTLDPANILYTLSLLMLSFSYSSPPWRFKSRPPLDSITAGLCASFIPFAMGFCHGGSMNWNPPFQIYIFSMGAMGIHAFTTLMDYDADQTTFNQTFAVRFGRRQTALFSSFAMLIVLFFLKTLLLRGFVIFCMVCFLLNALFVSQKFARITCLAVYALVLIVSLSWIMLNL